MLNAIKCLLGKHRWKQKPETMKQTGFAVQHLIFAVHELQVDEECQHCGLRRTRFGLVPDTIHYRLHAEEFRSDNGWPIDKDGKRLPSRDKAGRAIPKPIYHNAAESFSDFMQRLSRSV